LSPIISDMEVLIVFPLVKSVAQRILVQDIIIYSEMVDQKRGTRDMVKVVMHWRFQFVK
jgi:hypothetical protein